MLDCKGEMIERKDRVRMLMSEIKEDKMTEASEEISEAESSPMSRFCHESHSEFRSIHGNLVDLLHEDGHLSRFKMSVCSTNPLGKVCLDNASISKATTETSTYFSDTEDSLKEENDLLEKLFEEPDAVVEELVDSDTHVIDHKSVSTDIISKIWQIT